MAASVKLAKCLLISFNLFFWLCGIALMALGLFVLIALQTDDLMRSLRDKAFSLDTEICYIAIGMIGVGFIAFLIGFCGCCGAVRDSKFMNGFYIALLTLIICAEVAGGVFAVIYRDRIETVVTRELTTIVNHHYSHNDTKSVWNAISTAFDRYMFDKSCCGVNNYTDWWNSSYMRVSNDYYPIYCCQLIAGSNFTSPQTKTESGKCHKSDTKFVLKSSCAAALHQSLHFHAIILIAILFSFAAIQLAGVGIAAFFCHRLLHPLDEQITGEHEEEREPMANNDKEDV